MFDSLSVFTTGTYESRPTEHRVPVSQPHESQKDLNKKHSPGPAPLERIGPYSKRPFHLSEVVMTEAGVLSHSVNQVVSRDANVIIFSLSLQRAT